ncbi:formate dehydrogenase accessory sulfurtransferase FdhD [Methanolobus profundi]|uniref:Sulfur carrier protein FdhD n=1 Tax=Methanolobus profundi TaxID=487685 RepID=A0A1I4USK3_9EURY|nr:formate dehydrogenase accessory sulfurtransferase FdhD [Methanolobus profundi]SFM91954.1 FdhD protein [Methanolobus profundi]
MYTEFDCIKGDADSFELEGHQVIEEMPLAVRVNGRHALTAMISPDMLREFVLGFLYTEGIIKDVDEIESIKIENTDASVLTKSPFKILVSKKTVLSGCGGSMSYLDIAKLPEINSDLTLDSETIRNSVKEALDSELHVLTGGIHVVGLYNAEGKVCVVEDIGRHNALDKIIGYALERGIDLSRTYIICSGRISSEMVRKCLTANIPIVVSRGATTTLAIDIARARGLTIIGFVRSKKMNVYSWGKRITDIPEPVCEAMSNAAQPDE